MSLFDSRTSPFAASFALMALVTLAACSKGPDRPPSGTRDAGADGGCTVGERVCSGAIVQRCEAGGARTELETCLAPLVCAPMLGCATCVPGNRRCSADTNAVETCRIDGSGWDVLQMCAVDEVCSGGGLASVCRNGCEEAVATRSNLGCEYWAVDLDNEYSNVLGIVNDAAGQQFAVALANPSSVRVSAQVWQNVAALGETPVEERIFDGVIEARDVLEVQLPKREVDGSSAAGNNDGPGTFVSSRAYHVVTNFPVVAYQFNPIEQAFSNDASLLIPQTGLDNHYRVIGWPTSNPGSFLGPQLDYAYVTVVGTLAETRVTVRVTNPVVPGGGVPATAAGGTVTWTLGPYDVLNLEGLADIGMGVFSDFSGTVVESDKPVAVFVGNERGSAPYMGAPEPPGGRPKNSCCTDHLEEQVFPTTSWGQDFVLTHSPQRGVSWVEPDVYRVLADREVTTVTTNLSGADASFTLEPGQWREFYAQRSFTLRADHPISVQQVLVSQGWVDDWIPGRGGDPSMTLFPPYQQYREDYVFLTPSTFSTNFMVLAAPLGTRVLLDGRDVNGSEFDPLCTYAPAGEIEGVTYQAVTCPVDPGVHRVVGDMPVGLTIYGYYNLGSYAYSAGSNLERINFF